MPPSINRGILYGLLVSAPFAAGCRPGGPSWDMVPVEGTVTKEGRPLANLEVAFRADVEAGTLGPRSRGVTDEAGHYRLRADNGDEGAVVGQHRVCVVDKKAKPNTPPAKRQVPTTYAGFDTTTLRARVGPGPFVFDIAIP